jgi:hypothetical protein
MCISIYGRKQVRQQKLLHLAAAAAAATCYTWGFVPSSISIYGRKQVSTTAGAAARSSIRSCGLTC